MFIRNRLIPAIWFAKTLRRPCFILTPPGLASSSASPEFLERGEFFQYIFLDLAAKKSVSAFFSPDYYTAPVLSTRVARGHPRFVSEKRRVQEKIPG